MAQTNTFSTKTHVYHGTYKKFDITTIADGSHVQRATALPPGFYIAADRMAGSWLEFQIAAPTLEGIKAAIDALPESTQNPWNLPIAQEEPIAA